MKKTRQLFCFNTSQIHLVKRIENCRVLKVTGFADIHHPITNEFVLKILEIQISSVLEPYIQTFLDLFLDNDGKRRRDELIRIGDLVQANRD